MINFPYQNEHIYDENDLFHSLADFLSDKKSKDILLIDFKDTNPQFTHVIIATALSTPHLKHLAEESVKFFKQQGGVVLGFNANDFDTGWLIIDCGDLIVHLFLQEFREKYKLEELYAEG